MLEQQPNRYRALAGAAACARRARNDQKAAYYSTKLLELTKDADSPRPEIAEVRERLGALDR
ncbi:MAG: hypothetical protein QM706_12295 [Nitrospira sp.]